MPKNKHKGPRGVEITTDWMMLIAAVLGTALAAHAQRRPPMPDFKAPPFRATAPAPAPPVGKGAALSGHLTKPTAKVITLSYAPDWRGHLTQTISANLTATGDYRLLVPVLPAPIEARLGYADRYATVYLSPGDNLQVTFDPARLGATLAFSGPGAAPNNYLAQAERATAQADDARQTPDAQASALSAADLRRVADAYRQRRLSALQAYAMAHPLPAAFLRQQQAAIDYEWAGSLLSYYSRQSVARQRDGYATLPVDYYDFLRDLQLDRRDSALTQASFQGLLMTYGFTQLNTPTGALPVGPAAGRRLYQQATDVLGDGPVRDVAIGQYLLGKVEYEHTDIRPLLPDFQAHNHDSTIARAVRTAVRAHLALTAGQPAPAFTLQDASGKPVALSDFRGKVVYLDFWATWCAPCLAEMPASLELRQKFAGRDVVFLYVSLDAKVADWQQYLRTRQTTTPANAVQLHDGTAFDGAAARAFAVQSSPSYWLIGRDGRIIVNPAPRPSARPASDAALEQALQP